MAADARGGLRLQGFGHSARAAPSNDVKTALRSFVAYQSLSGASEKSPAMGTRLLAKGPSP